MSFKCIKFSSVMITAIRDDYRSPLVLTPYNIMKVKFTSAIRYSANVADCCTLSY